MKISFLPLLIGIIGVTSCLLTNCNPDANARAMMPPLTAATHRTGIPIRAAVINGVVQNENFPNIHHYDFKQALERSLVCSGLFSSVGGDGFRIEAFVTAIRPTRVGEMLRVNLEVRYALRRRSLIVWRKTVGSSYEVPVHEVKADLRRIREATEGAVRRNIAILILLLDKQRL